MSLNTRLAAIKCIITRNRTMFTKIDNQFHSNDLNEHMALFLYRIKNRLNLEFLIFIPSILLEDLDINDLSLGIHLRTLQILKNAIQYLVI